jgi:hypothetical protein
MRRADPLSVAIGMAETSPKHLEEQGGREQERLALPIREDSEASASVGASLYRSVEDAGSVGLTLIPDGLLLNGACAMRGQPVATRPARTIESEGSPI